MQIDNGWINVRSLYQYRHVDSTVLYVDMSLSKLCRDISTLSAVDKSTRYKGCNYYHAQTSAVCWGLGMDKWFNPTCYNGCNYLSMLGLSMLVKGATGAAHEWNTNSVVITPTHVSLPFIAVPSTGTVMTEMSDLLPFKFLSPLKPGSPYKWSWKSCEISRHFEC